MLRRTSLPVVLLSAACVTGAGLWGYAQDRERAEGLFRYSDRDGNGVIDSEEFRRLSDGTRERLEKMGINRDSNLQKDAFINAIVSVEEMRRKEQEERDRERGSSSSSPSSGRGKPPQKTRVTANLPPQYAALDKNGDGQIGLYEWDRAKLAEFRSLDRNGDGFLTPRELLNPVVAVTPPTISSSSAVSSSAAKPATPAAGPNPSPKTTSANSRPGSTGTPSAAPAQPTEDPLVRQAKFYFGTVDKDKDGQITAEEWASSRGARPMFEKANVTPTLPMSLEVFSEHFKQIKASQQ